MRVWLRPDRMAQLGVSTSDIAAAILHKITNMLRVRLAQTRARYQQLVYTVNAKGRLADPAQIGNIIIKADGPYGVLYLKDVSRIELGAQSYNVTSALNGQPGVAIPIFLQSGANALDTAKGIKDKVEELKAHFPAGMQYTNSLRHQ